mmetsp:Transcript_9621/g.30487  ORF Transcript_9621/g.30487 Transcript_9621/m.30487 type:complete len:222 (+) Transcript_9621:1659-2324(+)
MKRAGPSNGGSASRSEKATPRPCVTVSERGTPFRSMRRPNMGANTTDDGIMMESMRVSEAASREGNGGDEYCASVNRIRISAVPAKKLLHMTQIHPYTIRKPNSRDQIWLDNFRSSRGRTTTAPSPSSSRSSTTSSTLPSRSSPPFASSSAPAGHTTVKAMASAGKRQSHRNRTWDVVPKDELTTSKRRKTREDESKQAEKRVTMVAEWGGDSLLRCMLER